MNIKILKSAKNNFIERINQINKKLAKSKIEPISYNIINEFTTTENLNDIKVKVSWLEIEITIPIENYQINDYKLLGVITIKNGCKTIYSINDQKNLLNYIDVQRCDHCNTQRIRNTIYVLEKDNKEFVIGSTCVKDYFGIDIANYLSKGINYLKDFSIDKEFNEYSSFNKYYPNFEKIVSIALFYIEKQKGYIKEITAQNINFLDEDPKYLQGNLKSEWEKEFNEFKMFLTNEKIDLVKKIQNYWENFNPKTNFEFNIQQRFNNQTTNSFSLIACGVNIYMKENNLLINKETNKEKTNNEYFGNIGDKVENILEIQRFIPYENAYGTGYIIILKNQSNHILKWFTGSNILNEINEPFKAKFTIKNHEEYKNQKSTIISRLKVL